MAKLEYTSYELPPFSYKDGVSFNESAHNKAFDELRRTNKLVSFSVADGQAWYIVKSERPLLLQHVNFLDGYRVHPAMIRGLSLKEIKMRLELERLTNEYFKDKK